MKIKFISLSLAIIVLLNSCNSQNTVQMLNPVDFKEKITNNTDAIVIDVRTPEEFEGGYIANAVNINYNSNDFENEISKLDKNKTYLLYCLSGMRSASAATYMLNNGFKNISNLEGGILLWQKNNLPVNTKKSEKDMISMQAYQQMITSDTLVLVDFFAPWCAPCIKMKPMLEEIEKEYAGKVKVIRLNISENKELAKKLNVTEIPIFKTFLKGKETWIHKGYIEKSELTKQLSKI